MANHRPSNKVERFLLARGEWLAVGFAALAIGHAILATHWVPWSKQPQDLTSRVESARKELAKHVWPESERSRFQFGKEVSVAEIVQHALHEPLALSGVAASQKPYHKLGADKPPLVEPVLNPVLEFVATSERVLLPQLSREAFFAPIPETETAPDDVTPDEFRPRGGFSTRATTAADRRGTAAALRQAAGRGTLQTAPTPAGHGYPFVAVRGLIDVPQQVRAYVDAIHQSYPVAERAFEIIDFELERQRELGDSDWSAWEAVDRGVYFEIVRSAGGIEPDVIDVALTDSTITGPLPQRLTGRWSKTASHPRLVEFALTKEELARELEYLRVLTERARQRPAPRPGVVEKRGFAGLVQDVRAVQQSVFNLGMQTRPARPQFGTATSSADRQMQQFLQELVREMQPGAVDPQLVAWVRARATAQRKYLLFRYLDFEVQPGETYRYRVRLSVLNPNFGRSLAAASSASVVAGATRWTPWSVPTPPVAVDSLANYFLAGLQPEKLRPGVAARMHVYQYETAVGTTAEHMLPVVPGQAIGGTARVSRPNPVLGVIDDGPYVFRTPDSLVDGIADLTLSAAEHPELRLPTDARGRAYVTEMALISQPGRGLRILDTVTQAADYARQQQAMTWQDEQFQSFREAIDQPVLIPGDDGDEAFAPRRDHRSNPLQKL
ncbi:MAG: hypothetical protein JNG89_14505 [Planctomycetaceae bacterium]|nr:hypothetical protein [Planctomycetaceae bacterium]